MKSPAVQLDEDRQPFTLIRDCRDYDVTLTVVLPVANCVDDIAAKRQAESILNLLLKPYDAEVNAEQAEAV